MFLLRVQSEEQESIPPGSGNFGSDSAQGLVLASVVFEAVGQHFDDEGLSLEFASHQRARLWQATIALTVDDADLWVLGGVGVLRADLSASFSSKSLA